MCLGAVFVLGGVGMAVSNVADSHPSLTKLVTAWIRASLPGREPNVEMHFLCAQRVRACS